MALNDDELDRYKRVPEAMPQMLHTRRDPRNRPDSKENNMMAHSEDERHPQNTAGASPTISARFHRRERTDGIPQHFVGLNSHLLTLQRSKPTLTAAEVDNLSPEARMAFDGERLRYLSQGMVVSTKTIEELEQAVAEALDANFARPSGGIGLFLNAPPVSGKTTSLLHVLSKILTEILERDPEVLERGEVPVGYVAIPAVGSARSIYAVLADFLGMEYTPGANEYDLAKAVRNGVNLARMEVLVIDEVQNLENGEGKGIAVADALRRLSDDIGTTVALAGIDLGATSIVRGRRGQQISHRVIPVPVYNYADRDEPGWQREWPRLVERMVLALPLCSVSRVQAKEIAPPLYVHTGGVISEVNDVLTKIARMKIRAGKPTEETISPSDLALVRRTIAGEMQVRRTTPRFAESPAKKRTGRQRTSGGNHAANAA